MNRDVGERVLKPRCRDASHRLRTEPAQHNTLEKLQELLKQVHKNDAVVILGDFNEQLPPNVDNHTGKFAYGSASKNADDILNILRLHDLFAVSTKFQPSKNATNATHIATTRKERNDDNPDTFLGRHVSARYKGNQLRGTV